MTTSGSLFTGYGGLDLALAQVIDAEMRWVCDNDKGAAKVLRHRWPDLPNLGDITTVDWSHVEPVDILTGGFPCQDLSHAGRRRGLGPDTRSGLWGAMARAIAALRPELVLAENVRGVTSADAASDVEPCPWCLGDDGSEHALRALGAVLGDLADLGYDARWCGLRASDVGAPHRRFRVFILATNAHGERPQGAQPTPRRDLVAGSGPPPNPESVSYGQPRHTGRVEEETSRGLCEDGHETRPDAPSHHLVGARGGTDDARGLHAGRRLGDEWGPYREAIERWEEIHGPAPDPSTVNSRGEPSLSPRFVEWVMGLPDRWVTGTPGLARTDQLRILGNGVVPQQGAAALERLLT